MELHMTSGEKGAKNIDKNSNPTEKVRNFTEGIAEKYATKKMVNAEIQEVSERLENTELQSKDPNYTTPDYSQQKRNRVDTELENASLR